LIAVDDEPPLHDDAALLEVVEELDDLRGISTQAVACKDADVNPLGHFRGFMTNVLGKKLQTQLEKHVARVRKDIAAQGDADMVDRLVATLGECQLALENTSHYELSADTAIENIQNSFAPFEKCVDCLLQICQHVEQLPSDEDSSHLLCIAAGKAAIDQADALLVKRLKATMCHLVLWLGGEREEIDGLWNTHPEVLTQVLGAMALHNKQCQNKMTKLKSTQCRSICEYISGLCDACSLTMLFDLGSAKSIPTSLEQSNALERCLKQHHEQVSSVKGQAHLKDIFAELKCKDGISLTPWTRFHTPVKAKIVQMKGHLSDQISKQCQLDNTALEADDVDADEVSAMSTRVEASLTLALELLPETDAPSELLATKAACKSAIERATVKSNDTAIKKVEEGLDQFFAFDAVTITQEWLTSADVDTLTKNIMSESFTTALPPAYKDSKAKLAELQKKPHTATVLEEAMKKKRLALLSMCTTSALGIIAKHDKEGAGKFAEFRLGLLEVTLEELPTSVQMLLRTVASQ